MGGRIFLCLILTPGVCGFIPSCGPSLSRDCNFGRTPALRTSRLGHLQLAQRHNNCALFHRSNLRDPEDIARRSGPSDSINYEDTVRMPIAELEHEDEQLIVIDPDEQKTIRCLIDQQVVIDGTEYVLGYPCDPAVVLAYPDASSDALNAVPPSDIPLLFPSAAAAAREQGLTLINSAVVMTLQGEVGGEASYSQEEPPSEEDSELVRVIATFEVKGAQCLMTEPIDPVLIVSRVAPQSSELAALLLPPPNAGERRLVCELLPQPELEAVLPKIEALLSKRFNAQLDDAGISL